MAQSNKEPSLLDQILQHVPEKDRQEVKVLFTDPDDQQALFDLLQAGKPVDDFFADHLCLDGELQAFVKARAAGFNLQEAVAHARITDKQLETAMQELAQADPASFKETVGAFFDWYAQEKAIPTWDDLDLSSQEQAELSLDKLFGPAEHPPAGLPPKLSKKWPKIRKWLSLVYTGPLATVLEIYLSPIAQSLKEKERQLEEKAKELDRLAQFVPEPTQFIQRFLPALTTKKGRLVVRKETIEKKIQRVSTHDGLDTGMEYTAQLFEGTQALFAFEPTDGSLGDTIDKWMHSIQNLNLDLYMTTKACLAKCADNRQNQFILNIQELCRMRGLAESSKSWTKIKNHIQQALVLNYVVTAVKKYRKDKGSTLTLKLLMESGDVKDFGKRNRRPLYMFNDIFYQAMMQGLVAYYHRGILKANAYRDEWAIRAYEWACGQWAAGSAENLYFDTGWKLQPTRMTVICKNAGIHVDWSRRPITKLREHFQRDLDKLRHPDPGWSPDPFIADWTVEEHPVNPAEDKYTLTPPDAHIYWLETSNSKSLKETRKWLATQQRRLLEGPNKKS